MKPLITRWKIVPSKSGSLVDLPVRGSVHSFVPSASPTKFLTVFGARSGKSLSSISPTFVVMIANSSSATRSAPLLVRKRQ